MDCSVKSQVGVGVDGLKLTNNAWSMCINVSEVAVSKLTTHQKYPNFLPDQREFFDELIVNEWETYQSTLWDLARDFEVERLFQRVRPAKILDVGCGCGYHDQKMASFPFVKQVVGIDYSAKSIDKANEAYPHPKVRRFHCDIRDNDRLDFDLVTSFQVIEHVEWVSEFIKHSARSTKSGGFVAISTPNRLRLNNRIRHFFGRHLLLEDPQHFQEYTVDELVKISEGEGLCYYDSFQYGLSFIVPKIGREIVPAALRTRLGYFFPKLADRFVLVLRKL